jgi:hypothetical protein
MPRSRTTLARELRSIQTSLKRLEKSFARLAPLIRAEARQEAPRRSITITPARRAALKLQGQYMGHMRGLKPAQKKKVKRIKETKGIRSAIAAAKRLT